MTSPAAVTDGPPVAVALRDVEAEISRQIREIQGTNEAPAARARMSNLVIHTPDEATAADVASQLPEIFLLHPTRVILLVADRAGETAPIKAGVRVRTIHNSHLCFEQIELRAAGKSVDHLPFAVRGLLVGDIPTNLWWCTTQPPSLAGTYINDLTDMSEQIIFDSLGWVDGRRGMCEAANWLARTERGNEDGGWRVVSDLNWRRLKFWRRVLSQALDPAATPGFLDKIVDIEIDHGPHAMSQGWLISSWLATQLGWKFQSARVQPGTEIALNFLAPHGIVKSRIDRLPEGPREVTRIKIIARDRPDLEIRLDERSRLHVCVDCENTAPRTLTAHPVPTPELVARQLSDRAADPVFRSTLETAQALAQSLEATMGDSLARAES